MWEQGLSIGEIAKQIGCIGNTVSQILRAEGLYNAEEVRKRMRKTLSEVNGKQLQAYYTTEEHRQERINNGLKGAKARSKPIIVYQDKECTQLVGVYDSGRQCAKALGINHSLPSYAVTHNHYSSGYYFYFLDDKPARECTTDQVK